jgi:hypothetical protein
MYKHLAPVQQQGCFERSNPTGLGKSRQQVAARQELYKEP